MNQGRVASLFLSHIETNSGYAVISLERLFYDVGLELAGGDPNLVHFGYPDFTRGFPKNLPEDFCNYILFDFKDRRNETDRQHLVSYVREKGIRLVSIFDIHPLDPIFRPLREAGAAAIVSYWGAPTSLPVPWWKGVLKKVEFARSRSKVDGLIFESKAMAETAVRGAGVPRRMIEIVPLGAEIERFKPIASDYVYETLGFPRDRRVVVYSGHIQPRKGVRVLVEAAIDLLVKRRRSDVCFLVCGNLGDQSKVFEQMYAGLGIDNLIRFGGYRSDLPQVFPSCFCGVIPSTGWDSFTLSSAEMAAAGLPLVASRLDGLQEAVLDGVTGLLFEPGNACQLADYLAYLLDQPGLAAEYGRRARQRCEAELNRGVQRARLATVYRKWLHQAK